MTASSKIPEEGDSDNDQISYSEDEIQDTDIDVYSQLNKELDEINNFLDALEEKNANLHAELTKLLEESKQIRQELNTDSS